MEVNELLDKLAAFQPTGFPVISLYLNAQADQHGQESYGPFVRKELGERANGFDPGSAERESFDQDVERINRFLEEEARPSANGIAIFACSAADLFEAAQLDAPIEENQLYIFDQPHLYPLARLLDQYPRYAVLVADTNSARIFVFGRGRTLETEEIQNVKTKRTQVGGWSQMRFQRHVENYHLHHAKEVIDALDRVVADDRIEQIILSGDQTTIIPILREQMPKHLLDKVIDVVNLGVDTPEHEILESTMKTLRVHDAVTDAEKVEEMFDQYRAGGLAVVGVADTLAALSNGQVDELLVSASLREIQYSEQKVDKVLAAYAPGADGEQPDASEPRMVADELVRLAQQTSARVTFIEDTSLLASAGGVGATLRYRIG
jgi:peptide subunit release factor 1 (eRF1)